MQALVKYHGLKDWDLRIPYHDSISVNTDCLYTITSVTFGDFERDVVYYNGAEVDQRTYERVRKVLDRVRSLTSISERAIVRSQNSLPYSEGKGLGFSAAAGASLAAAAYVAAGLTKTYGWDLRLISRLARLFSGSACRSVVGEYARWYAGTSDEDSFAERVASRRDLDIVFCIIPFPSEISTEEAHRESPTSSFFRARIESAQKRCDEMERAIKEGDYKRVFELAELDSLELHAVTMTGESRRVIFTEDTIRIMRKVVELRKQGVVVYYSFQTGPSIFLNTLVEHVDEVVNTFREMGYKLFISRVGGGVELIDQFKLK